MGGTARLHELRRTASAATTPPINPGGLPTGDGNTIVYGVIPWSAGGYGDGHLEREDQWPGWECQDGGFDPASKPTAEKREKAKEENATEKEEFEKKSGEEKLASARSETARRSPPAGAQPDHLPDAVRRHLRPRPRRPDHQPAQPRAAEHRHQPAAQRLAGLPTTTRTRTSAGSSSRPTSAAPTPPQEGSKAGTLYNNEIERRHTTT